ncbi:ribulokinase [Clostridium aestuarii]|uniref:Ribulokinase n=1 Tax=Clostridium aestuarii TaxID=338193 RepID=A0ABT4D3R0_9CLOT|nr:ribulokinase [Clostridium aestuarii]MCY6484673.1 ribulokinase [Clostridium aestuarii]
MSKYSIGIDYGTESARALLVNLETAEDICNAVMAYPHGVMSECLPDGTKLSNDWALEHPDDYIEVLKTIIPSVIEKSGIDTKDVVGIGIDFTACTILPIKEDGTPLCDLDKFKSNPHSYVKLWKHHAAQPEANKLNNIADSRNENFMSRYGGKISSEWFVPKVWQVLDEAPEVYNEADKFMEAADWVILKLTGKEKRNSCTAGYKALWHKQNGYPSKEFFKALDCRMENLIDEKMSRDIYPLGTKAGEITKNMADMLGLIPGIAVAVANVDAHVAVPASGVTESGKMVMVMGTSTCHLLLGDVEKNVPGMCGCVEDGIVPGYYGYEAGQSAVGDTFAWFVNNCIPESYYKEAKEKDMNIHVLLTEKAAKLKPGESGLLALDWWNGNRSVLVDTDLTGLIMGMTLNTKPEEIYRALIEATAYGTNKIIETFNENGVKVEELYACGGLPQKNRMLMQIYSDVTGLSIKIAESTQTPALGSAMFGAVAAGKENGGFDSIVEAAKVMAKLKDEVIKPIPKNHEIYKVLFQEYGKLHDYFGRSMNDVMKTLKKLKEN